MKPIVLNQMWRMGGLETSFSMDPWITKGSINKFFVDVVSVLRELDPEINKESRVYTRGSPFRIGISDFVWPSALGKYLHVLHDPNGALHGENQVRCHNLNYKRKPTPLSPELEERLKDNMYASKFDRNDNLTIYSSDNVYSPEDLIDRLNRFSYIRISDQYSGTVFDPMAIVDAVVDPQSRITSTGTILKGYGPDN